MALLRGVTETVTGCNAVVQPWSRLGKSRQSWLRTRGVWLSRFRSQDQANVPQLR